MSHMKTTWISISLSLSAIYGCNTAQNSEELRGQLGGRENEIGTCYAICSSNKEFWCGTLGSPLTKSACINYEVADIQPPIPGFKRFEWEAGGRPRPRGGVVDAPGQNQPQANKIEQSDFVCQISRSEKLYFNIEDRKAYYEDFSKPEILEESTLNKARNMDPYSFSFNALADKYTGTTRDPGFPGKPSNYVLLELTRPTKRSAICNLLNGGMPDGAQGLPQPHGGMPDGAQGLPQPHRGMPDGAQGLPQPHGGMPDGAQGLPQPHGGMPDGAQGLPQPNW